MKTQKEEPKTISEMTPEEVGALVLAKNEGKTIQKWGNGSWYQSDPRWHSNRAYRVKPEKVRQKFMMHAKDEKSVPYISKIMSNPTHDLIFVWEDGELVDVEVRKWKLPM